MTRYTRKILQGLGWLTVLSLLLLVVAGVSFGQRLETWGTRAVQEDVLYGYTFSFSTPPDADPLQTIPGWLEPIATRTSGGAITVEASWCKEEPGPQVLTSTSVSCAGNLTVPTANGTRTVPILCRNQSTYSQAPPVCRMQPSSERPRLEPNTTYRVHVQPIWRFQKGAWNMAVDLDASVMNEVTGRGYYSSNWSHRRSYNYTSRNGVAVSNLTMNITVNSSQLTGVLGPCLDCLVTWLNLSSDTEVPVPHYRRLNDSTTIMTLEAWTPIFYASPNVTTFYVYYNESQGRLHNNTRGCLEAGIGSLSDCFGYVGPPDPDKYSLDCMGSSDDDGACDGSGIQFVDNNTLYNNITLATGGSAGRGLRTRANFTSYGTSGADLAIHVRTIESHTTTSAGASVRMQVLGYRTSLTNFSHYTVYAHPADGNRSNMDRDTSFAPINIGGGGSMPRNQSIYTSRNGTGFTLSFYADNAGDGSNLIYRGSLELAPSATTTTNVTLYLSDQTENNNRAHRRISSLFTAHRGVNGSIGQAAVFNLTVGAEENATLPASVNLSLNATAALVLVGGFGRYLVTVNNNGSSNGTFTLALNNSDGIGTAVLNATSALLVPGGIARFVLNVSSTVPGVFRVGVNASTGASFQSAITTTTFPGGDINLSTNSTFTRINANVTGIFWVRVHNNGSANSTYNLSALSSSGTARANQSNLSVPVGDTRVFQVLVNHSAYGLYDGWTNVTLVTDTAIYRFLYNLSYNVTSLVGQTFAVNRCETDTGRVLIYWLMAGLGVFMIFMAFLFQVGLLGMFGSLILLVMSLYLATCIHLVSYITALTAAWLAVRFALQGWEGH